MKIYQVMFDDSFAVMVFDNDENLNRKVFEELKQSCFEEYVIIKDDGVYIDWGNGTVEKCYIQDVTDERGIISFESK